MATIILLSYFIAISGVSFLGGRLSFIISMTHTRIQILMSFISGFIIGVAIYHLLLHSIEYISGTEAFESVVGSMMLGIVSIIILLRTFHLHQHEFTNKESKSLEHKHDHMAIKKTSLFSIILGLGLHSIMEGIALGASIQVDLNLHQSGGQMSLGSLGVLVAIVLHKPLDSYSIIGMMRSSGYNHRTCTMINILFSLLCPLIMVFTFWSITLLSTWDHREFMGYLLAFASGSFLCIALSDLLPEIQFHRHDRFKLTLAFLIGILLSYFLHLLTE